MFNKAKIIISLIPLLLLFGCGLKQGVVQKDSVSYLSFTGNIHNAEVYIDEGDAFLLEQESTEDNPVHYQVEPGKHVIVIKKMGRRVLHRQILLGDGIVKEIRVP